MGGRASSFNKLLIFILGGGKLFDLFIYVCLNCTSETPALDWKHLQDDFLKTKKAKMRAEI